MVAWSNSASTRISLRTKKSVSGAIVFVLMIRPTFSTASLRLSMCGLLTSMIPNIMGSLLRRNGMRLGRQSPAGRKKGSFLGCSYRTARGWRISSALPQSPDLGVRIGNSGSCRVEMWRGGCRSNISVSASFVWRCLSGATITPFPHPSHRTGHEDFPHPALGQDFTPSPTARRAQAGTGARARSTRKGARVDTSRPCVA